MPCIPCNMLDLLGATVGRAAAKECACKSAIALLVRLGATGAAKMHAEGAEDHPEKWSKSDWVQHFQEEKRLFFPLLPEPVRAQLLAEHEIFLDELAKQGKITSLDILRSHSVRENMWAERLLSQSDEPMQVRSTQAVIVGNHSRARSVRVGQAIAITDSDRQNAALTSADIEKLCASLAGVPGFGGLEACRANFQKVRDEAQAKIASMERVATPAPQAPQTQTKSGFHWPSAPVLVAAGTVIALGVGALVWMAKLQARPGISYFTT